MYKRDGETIEERATYDQPDGSSPCPPMCRRKEGCPKGTPENPNSLSPENERCYEHFRECKAVGQFPDDPIVRRNAAVIQEILDKYERDQKEGFFTYLKMLATIRHG